MLAQGNFNEPTSPPSEEKLMAQEALQVTRGDKPEKSGMYVVYHDEGHGIPFAAKELLMWIDGRWGYPSSDQFFRPVEKIVGYIGPIPALRL